MLACRPNSDASGWCIQVRSKNNLPNGGRVILLCYFETRFSIILIDVLRGCLCVFGEPFHQWKGNHDRPGMPNFNHASVRYSIGNTDACFLLLLPGLRLHSVPTQTGLFHNLLSFDRTFNHPHDLWPPNASPYKHLAQSAPAVMQGYLMQSAKHVGVALGIC